MSGFQGNKSTKLWIGNIPKSASESRFIDLLKQYTRNKCDYIRLELVKSPQDTTDYFEVQFRSFEKASSAMEALRNKHMEGRKLQVEWYINKGIVWLSYLQYYCIVLFPACSPSTTKEDLVKSFDQFGEIISADTISCPFSGLCKGNGWIHFKRRRVALMLIRFCEENFFVMMGSQMPVSVTLAIEHDCSRSVFQNPVEELFKGNAYPCCALPNTIDWKNAESVRRTQLMIDVEKSMLKRAQREELSNLLMRQEEDIKKYTNFAKMLKVIISDLFPSRQ